MKLLIILVSLLPYLNYSSGQEINNFFEKINQELVQLNSIAAELTWESSVNPGSPNLQEKAADYQKKRINWQHSTCDKLATLQYGQLLNKTQRRQTFLLCRGPKFKLDEASKLNTLYDELQTIYADAKICLPFDHTVDKHNVTDVERAIQHYLSTVEEFTKYKNIKDFIALGAKLAVNNDTDKNIGLCLHGEEEFNYLMKTVKDEKILKWIWMVWREKVGPPMKNPYDELVKVQNTAARRNGYKDIGESWREDLEIPELRRFSRQLYNEVLPFYSLLHGVVRFYLRKAYGDIISEKGPIPAHLLGNLWSQNWEALSNLILQADIDMDASIEKLKWNVPHMVRRVDDFYRSMGLPAMPETFWTKSVFSRDLHDSTRCHGTAADMFKHGDYRLLYCSGKSWEDFYVLHHEIGHIQYYMAYENQTGVFRQANAALHESVGDAIMYGVSTPQHLHRLGLINNSILYTNEDNQNNRVAENNYKRIEDIIDNLNNDVSEKKNPNNNMEFYIKTIIDPISSNAEVEQFDESNVPTDIVILLKQALNKIPQIPFALLIDEYRWKYFEGVIDKNEANEEFWKLALDLQGIAPPAERGEDYFDIGTKYHVPDNTPYIRYFLSSFIQHQLFESLCTAAVYGHLYYPEPVPESIPMHRCDIYGSKAAGKLLKDFMSKGDSVYWRHILLSATGNDNISSAALMRYYRPLYEYLLKLARKYRIPIGW